MDETQKLLAKGASAYYTDLTDRGVPAELASQLVRDWHVAQIGGPVALNFTVMGHASYDIQSILRAARRQPLHITTPPADTDQGNS